MDMKKLSKVISIVLIVMMLVAIGTNVFAAVTGATNPSQLTGKAVSGTDKITSIGNQIITILTIVGTVSFCYCFNCIRIKIHDGKCRRKSRIQEDNDAICNRCSISICSISYCRNTIQFLKQYISIIINNRKCIKNKEFIPYFFVV